ncbi:MAG: hypothetical protein EOP88_26705 [Verrucomicrobiaceae bacterium]|nr:MAG: hypothetical protein EOP88_26705 [Verrucomicrobiaceae bacterium]
MSRLLSLAVVAVLPLVFSACCSHAQPRFWKVRDTKNGATAYTVDTAAVPTTSLVARDIRYVDTGGKLVEVRNPKMVREMPEAEWKAATSGAGYSLWYCGHRKACWAKAKAR